MYKVCPDGNKYTESQSKQEDEHGVYALTQQSKGFQKETIGQSVGWEVMSEQERAGACIHACGAGSASLCRGDEG